MDSKKAFRAIVAAAIGIFAFMGINSTFSIFLMSFIVEFGAPVGNIALAATVGCAISFIFSLFITGRCIKSITSRGCFLVSCILTVFYCGIHYLSTSVWHLVLAGCFGGAILGLGTHAVAIGAISDYFGVFGKSAPKKISLVLCFSAGGAAFYSWLPGMLIPVMGWRNVYLVLMAITIGLGLIAVFVLPKTEKKAAAAGAGAAAASNADVPGLTLNQATKTPSFFLLFLGILLGSIAYYGFTTYLVTYLQVEGMEVAMASTVQMVMQLAGMIVLFISGPVVQKFGAKGIVFMAFGGIVVGGLLFAFGVPATGAAVAASMVICIVLVFGNGLSSISAQVVPALFGNRDYNGINPIFSGAFYAGMSLASQVTGRIAPVASYTTAFLTNVVIAATGFVLIMVAMAASPMAKLAANTAPAKVAAPAE